MMADWKRIKLNDICSTIQYGYTESAQNEKVGPKFLRITDIVGELINWETVPYCPISNKDFEKYKLYRGDIVVARTGNTTGYAKLIRNDVESVFASYLIRFKIDETLAESSFVGRLLESELFKSYVWSIIGGSAQPGANAKLLGGFPLNLPPLPTQRKIASILSAYDDLIENNLKRIKLLEEKAQLTYEEWFSVKGTPNGWNEYKLGELIDFHIGGGWGEEFKTEAFPDQAYVIRGTDMDNLPLGSIENVPNRWHKASNLKSRRLQNGDIVFEVSGGSSYEGVAKTLLITEGLLNQFDSDVMCASFCKLMRPKSVSYSYSLILFLKYLRKTKATEIFEKRSASNIVNYNWEAFLKFQSVKMPNDALLKQFNDVVGPMISNIYNLGNQITMLKEARDILLPRLMTGMIDVDQIQLENIQPTTT